MIQAKRAMRQTIRGMQGSLRRSADLHAWADEHPWILLGTAGTAGFFSAVCLHRLSARVRRGPSHRTATLPAASSTARERRKPPWLSALAGMMLGAVQTAIQNSLIASLRDPEPDCTEPH
jgi:hypothetical protein